MRGFIDVMAMLAIVAFTGFVYLVWNNIQLALISFGIGLISDWAVRK